MMDSLSHVPLNITETAADSEQDLITEMTKIHPVLAELDAQTVLNPHKSSSPDGLK